MVLSEESEHLGENDMPSFCKKNKKKTISHHKKLLQQIRLSVYFPDRIFFHNYTASMFFNYTIKFGDLRNFEVLKLCRVRPGWFRIQLPQQMNFRSSSLFIHAV